MSLAYHPASYAVEMETVIDNLPSAIIVVDRDRRVFLANKQAVNLAHKSKEEFFGLRGGEAFGCVNSIKSPEGCGYAPECEFCKVRGTVMETFDERRGRTGVEAELTTTGMVRIPVRVSTSFVVADARDLVILAIEDISEQKMQDQIRLENARLRAATATAAAVCHEMSQPLMAMTGFVSLLMMEGNEDEQSRELVQAVKDQAARLGKITRKLMRLKSFETKGYAGGHQILDIEEASDVCG
jgi:nitrogen-specific signal transduction histidine kinase